MPNPVRSLLHRGGSLTLLVLSATCGAAFAQSPNEQQAVTLNPWPYTNLIAEGSQGHRLEIVTEAGIYNQATAILTFGGQTWKVTDWQCEQFRAALNTYRALPGLKPGPGLLLPGASPERPMPPYRPHGEMWTIRTHLHAPDWSAIAVEMRGGQGPYAFWMSDTVEVIKSCGPPLG